MNVALEGMRGTAGCGCRHDGCELLGFHCTAEGGDGGRKCAGRPWTVTEAVEVKVVEAVNDGPDGLSGSKKGV